MQIFFVVNYSKRLKNPYLELSRIQDNETLYSQSERLNTEAREGVVQEF